MLDTIISRFLNSVFIIASFASELPIMISYEDVSISLLFIPTPLVVLPCGSISINKVFFPNIPSEADKLTAVVVFPTPPF